jgi:DNA polymerase III gamma/tau subunit
MSLNKERAFKLLGKVLKKDLLAHAYLLTGSSEKAMEKLAMEIANFLLCQEPDLRSEVPSYCGKCPACKKISHMAHPDLLIIKPEGVMIKIAQIRAMQKSIAFPPLESSRRITLILDAHKMNLDASNALLKSLEEPPAGNHFFLTSPSSDQLLTTISSRCQEIRCPERAGVGLSIPKDMKETVFNFLCGPEIPALFKISKDMGKDQEKTLLFIHALRAAVRDMIFLASGENKCDLFYKDEKENLKQAFAPLNNQDLNRYAVRLEEVEAQLERNINRELILSTSLLFWLKIRE